MIEERLQQLENNLAELQHLKQTWSLDDITSDKSKEWSLRYGVLESLQMVIDIACHKVADQNLGNPETEESVGLSGS